MDLPSVILESIQKVFEADQIELRHQQLLKFKNNTLPSGQLPIAIVYPKDKFEVQKLVELSNRHLISLWPSSRGLNWGYGSMAPLTENSIIVNLSRMNKIVMINQGLKYAVIEPGVTYRQLRSYLNDHHPELWCDCTDGPPEGSVIGNALDRGLGVTNYGDHFSTLCGLSVVVGTGEIIHTGGPPARSKTFNTHKWGLGPYIEGLFSQSSFGIVVEAGIWLFPKPESFVSFTAELFDEKNIGLVVDQIHEMSVRGVLSSYTHIVNDIVLLAVFKDSIDDKSLLKQNYIPQGDRKKMLKSLGLPLWSFGGGVYGTKEQVKVIKKEILKRLGAISRITFISDLQYSFLKKAIDVHDHRKFFFKKENDLYKFILEKFLNRRLPVLRVAVEAHSLLQGIPNDFFVKHAYFKSSKSTPTLAHPDNDEIGLIWIAPVIPLQGNEVNRIIEICEPLYKSHNTDFYLALLVQNSRSMIALQCIFYDKTNPESIDNAKKLYQLLMSTLSDESYQSYRLGLLSMENMYQGDSSYQNIMQNLKKTFDPNRIIAPGRYGL